MSNDIKKWLMRYPIEPIEDKVIKNLDSVQVLINEYKEVKKELEEKCDRILELENRADKLRAMVRDLTESNHQILSSLTPAQVFHNKERRNTTVKFLNGESVTVKRMKGDKDCIETAIAYAILKKVINKKILKLLVENVVETGGKHERRTTKID